MATDLLEGGRQLIENGEKIELVLAALEDVVLVDWGGVNVLEKIWRRRGRGGSKHRERREGRHRK
jgi:hypothetical protein